VNKEASHYVKLFGGNKIGNLTFWLPLVYPWCCSCHRIWNIIYL